MMDIDKDWYQAVKAYHNGDYHDIKTFLRSDTAANHGIDLDDFREFRRASQSFDARWQAAVKTFTEGKYKTKKAFISSSKFLKFGFSPSGEHTQVLKYALQFYEEEYDFRASANTSKAVALAGKWGAERPWVVLPEFRVISGLTSFQGTRVDIENPASLCDSSVSQHSGATSSPKYRRTICAKSKSLDSANGSMSDGTDETCDFSISQNSIQSSTASISVDFSRILATKQVDEESCDASEYSGASSCMEVAADLGTSLICQKMSNLASREQMSQAVLDARSSYQQHRLAIDNDGNESIQSLFHDEDEWIQPPNKKPFSIEDMLQDVTKHSDESNAMANFMFLLFAVVPLLVFVQVESVASIFLPRQQMDADKDAVECPIEDVECIDV